MRRLMFCTLLTLAACAKTTKVDTNIVGTVPRAAVRWLSLTADDTPLDLVVAVPGQLPATIGRVVAPRMSGYQVVPAGEAEVSVLRLGRVVTATNVTLAEGAAATTYLTDAATGPALTVTLDAPPSDVAKAVVRFIDASAVSVASVTLAAAPLVVGEGAPGPWLSVDPQEAGVLVVTTADATTMTFAPVPLAAGSVSTLALVGRSEDGNLRLAAFRENAEGGPTRAFIYPQGTQRPSAAVRLLHGVADGAEVRFAVDGTPAAEAVAYKELATSIDLPVDATLDVTTAAGVLLSTSPAELGLEAGKSYTLALLGSSLDPKLVAWQDLRTATTGPMARVAFGVAGIPGTFSVVRDDDPTIGLIDGVAYGEASAYTSVPAGPVDLRGQFTLSVQGQAVTRDVATLAGVTFPPDRAVTLVGVGTSGPPPSVSLLVIDDLLGTVGVLDPGPPDPPAPETASVRFLNATAIDEVSLGIDGTTAGSLPMYGLTNAQPVPVGALLKVSAGTVSSPERTLSLDKTKSYTVAIVGDASALDVVTWEDDRTGTSSRARLSLAATGTSGALKATHGADVTLFDGVSSGNISNWTTPPTPTEPLSFSLVDGGVATPIGSLPSVAWPQGHAATLVATGTLTASPAASQLTFLLVDEATGQVVETQTGVDLPPPPPPPPATASVRFLNATAVADVGLSLDGLEADVLTAFQLGYARSVPVGVVVKASAGGVESPERTLSLDTTKSYTIAIIGDASALDVVTWEDDRSGTATRARLALAASGTSGSLKATYGADVTLFDGVSFGSLSSWTTPPAPTEPLSLSLVDGAVSTPIGSLPSVAWPQGHAATLIATGTLTASPAAPQLTFLLVDEATGQVVETQTGVDLPPPAE
jgi:hypothetical protein